MGENYCLYCKFYEPTYNGTQTKEPEGICNVHTAIDGVYGHECCENFTERKEK